MDPFTAQPTLIVFVMFSMQCQKNHMREILEELQEKQKSMSKQVEFDTIYMGPEAEFFIFDDVKFQVDMNKSMFEIDSTEGPHNSGRSYESGNLAHRPGVKGGYFPVPPVDSAQDIKQIEELKNLGLKMKTSS